MTDELTRRQLLLIFQRLASLGLIETLRPVLERNVEFAELLAAETPNCTEFGTCEGNPPPSLTNMSEYLQSVVQDLERSTAELSGELAGVGLSGTFGFSERSYSIGGGVVFGFDPDTNLLKVGLYGSAAVQMTTTDLPSFGAGVTGFGGKGSIEGFYGPSHTVGIGSQDFSGSVSGSVSTNQDATVVGVTLGPSAGLPGTEISGGESYTSGSSTVTTFDLNTPFRLFYGWLDSVSTLSGAPLLDQ
jgi:hypothetical protein